MDDSGKVKICRGATDMLECLPTMSLDQMRDLALSLN
jgi:hypothetical protein